MCVSLSALTQLTSLDVYHLLNYEVAKRSFVESLSVLTALERLRMIRYDSEAIAWSPFCAALAKLRLLRWLSIHCVYGLTDQDVIATIDCAYFFL